MGEEYYILENGEKKGPFGFNQLVVNGIDIDTQVQVPGSDEWQSASYLPEFADYFTSQGYFFPTEDNLAPVGYRVIAYIVDYMLIGIVAALIVIKMGLIDVSDPTKFSTKEFMNTISMRTQLIMELIFAVIFICYNVLSEIGGARSSLGKRLCGLKVVDADGRRVNAVKALVRSIGIITGYSMIGLIIVAVSFFVGKHRQTWYERITNSFVIKT